MHPYTHCLCMLSYAWGQERLNVWVWCCLDKEIYVSICYAKNGVQLEVTERNVRQTLLKHQHSNAVATLTPSSQYQPPLVGSCWVWTFVCDETFWTRVRVRLEDKIWMGVSAIITWAYIAIHTSIRVTYTVVVIQVFCCDLVLMCFTLQCPPVRFAFSCCEEWWKLLG